MHKLSITLSRLALESLMDMIDEGIEVYTHLGDSKNTEEDGKEYYMLADLLREDKVVIARALVADDRKVENG